jgi:high affinity sulfate transporter 1
VIRQADASPGLAPGLRALRDRDTALLRADTMAGLTVAAALVPQVLAYSELAGLPAVAGLWAAVGAIAVYAVLGTSRVLAVGPESATAAMTAVAIAPLAGGSAARYAALSAALAIEVGVVCLLARTLRLAVLADLLSRPVLVGYLAGIAVLMIVSQLGNVTGVPVRGDSVPARLASFASQLHAVNPSTVVLAAGVLAVTVGLPRLLPHVALPSPLVAVLLATGVTAVVTPARLGVEVLGAVPSGVPVPSLPVVTLADLAALAIPATGVALVAFSDEVVTVRAFASRHGHPVRSSRELVALGGAGIAAGLMSGFPVSSSSSRTAIAHATGARSQLYALVALVAVVAVLLVGGPVLAAFPAAALGALVVYAASRLIDVGEFRRFAAFGATELALALVAAVGVLAFGVLGGILAAVGLSILDLLRKVSRPHGAVIGFVPGLPGMHDVDDHPRASTLPGLVVYRYDAPLCFANADDFRRRAMAAVDGAAGPVRWLLLNVEANVEIDLTAADALRALHDELGDHGVVLALARVKQELRDLLERAGLVDLIGADLLFPTLPTAVDAFRARYGGDAAAAT